MNKLDAVRAYETGDFSTNAEHPMVMKALMLVSSHLGAHQQRRSRFAITQCSIWRLNSDSAVSSDSGFLRSLDRTSGCGILGFRHQRNYAQSNRQRRYAARFLHALCLLLLSACETDIAAHTSVRGRNYAVERDRVWSDDRVEVFSALSRSEHAFSSQLSRAES